MENIQNDLTSAFGPAGAKPPAYKTTPVETGYGSRIHLALFRSRGNSSPGGPKEDCQIILEMFNIGRRCLARRIHRRVRREDLLNYLLR